MAQVTLHDLVKQFSEDVIAVNSVNLEIQDKEFVVLVGPSGCGKTTTLRMVAGLEDITAGEVFIGDRLAVFLSSTDIHCGWCDSHGFEFGKQNYEKAIQMGINIIMYAISH